jgi:hypothetical protein
LIFRHVDKTVEAVGLDDARSLLLEAGESGSFVISEAVLSSLRERGLSYGDVRNALANLASAMPTPADGAGATEVITGWTVVGPTMDGEQMTVTVAIESGIVMVI